MWRQLLSSPFQAYPVPRAGERQRRFALNGLKNELESWQKVCWCHWWSHLPQMACKNAQHQSLGICKKKEKEDRVMHANHFRSCISAIHSSCLCFQIGLDLIFSKTTTLWSVLPDKIDAFGPGLHCVSADREEFQWHFGDQSPGHPMKPTAV